MGQHRIDRTLLTEPTEKLGPGDPLVSIKDANGLHQRTAMLRGYSSVAEMAIDELISRYRELEERVTALERHGPGTLVQPDRP